MSMTIENQAKDIEPHHIGTSATILERLKSRAKADLVSKLEKDLQLVPEVGRIPQSVNAVCDVITREFTGTANTLRNQASNLRLRANQLDIMAKRIEGAATSVPDSIKDWIETEIEYRDAALRLSAVEPDPNFE